ncbi:MAG: IS5/IS1182 family transposase, partial [Cyanobacteria bacterium SW_10_48_33]
MTGKAYKSDRNETEWAILESLLPGQNSGGRPRSVDLAEVANGIFYVLT